jgi:hypothetical protein
VRIARASRLRHSATITWAVPRRARCSVLHALQAFDELRGPLPCPAVAGLAKHGFVKRVNGLGSYNSYA